MSRRLRLTDETWQYGSYPRETYRYDPLYLFYQYRDFTASFNLKTGRFNLVDSLVEQMTRHKRMLSETRTEYYQQAYQFMESAGDYDAEPIEQIYEEIHKIRRASVGEQALEEERLRSMRRGCEFEDGLGIDQRKKKDDLLRESETVIMVLIQPELFFLMEQDIRQALAWKRQVCILVDSRAGYGLPTREVLEQFLGEDDDSPGITWLPMDGHYAGLHLAAVRMNEQVQAQIDAGRACLIVYGEEGLLQCKSLLLDSVVYANVSCYYTKAVTNQLTDGLSSVVYVPKHFDITTYVPLLEKTRISYWQLAKLWEQYGDGIYEYSLRELYQRYPQFFLNIYASGRQCVEAGDDYPIRIRPEALAGRDEENWQAVYDAARDQAIGSYFNSSENRQYISTYFDQQLRQIPVPWGSREQQTGILVQGICLEKSRGAKVLSGSRTHGLRQMIREQKLTETDGQLQIFSNFLFFMTPKLALLYNELRRDRRREQYTFQQNHLDYMLCYRDGVRVETFPLYRKACIAMKEDGAFLFFNYRLRGGSLKLGGQKLRWIGGDVDVCESREECRRAPIRLYTPDYSRSEEGVDIASYQKTVGEDRLNLIVLQDKIICVRMGDVMLSSVGVVISLERSAGEALVRALNLRELEDGYYDCENLEHSLELERPGQVSEEDWKQVRWAYGGGISLILEGRGLCDENRMEEWLREEGWMTPLSCQTQESQVHKMARHPRTAIGVTKSGKLVVLVYSGRTRLSVGADYEEMCKICRQLFPDIWYLMNVDGGGSAVLGISIGGSFMELSYPALSLESTVGMIRPISTILCLK